MESSSPSTLFKYRPYTTQEEQRRVHEIITESRIFFASPTTFNDPFDCKVHFNSASRHGLHRLMTSQANEDRYRILAMSKGKSVAQLAKETDMSGFKSHMQLSLQEAVNKVGVFSLSEIETSVLMWSHYGSNHQGVCLHFDFRILTETFSPMFQVKYGSRYPRIDVTQTSMEEMAVEFFINKSSDWKYEREWRVLSLDDGSCLKDFPPEMLVGITFGTAMKTSHARELSRMTTSRTNAVPVFSLAKDQLSYRLVRV